MPPGGPVTGAVTTLDLAANQLLEKYQQLIRTQSKKRKIAEVISNLGFEDLDVKPFELPGNLPGLPPSPKAKKKTKVKFDPDPGDSSPKAKKSP